MEHGLVIDKMQNIRNTVQFEMEIQREEREDVMMKRAVVVVVVVVAQSVRRSCLSHHFETTPSNDANNL